MTPTHGGCNAGNTPSDGPIPITLPCLGEPEAEAAGRVILSGWTTQGPEVAAFEREFAQRVGAPHACAVSNCTTALHLAMHVAGIGPGDEVVTVSHSFIATANAVRHCGATPVFVDIEPGTCNIDPACVEQALTPRTKAILCVHQMGMPCDLQALVPLARRHGLVLVEDAACALGSGIHWNGQWEAIGRPHGDIACFSFHPRKVVSTGDGGMITTQREDWDARWRRLRQHAMSVPDTVRHGAATVIFEQYPEVGFNYRMTDIQAAVGRVQLQRLHELCARRREAVRRYRHLIADRLPVQLPHEPVWARSNWQSFCCRLPPQADQRAVMQFMLRAGVSTRRGIMCAHREPAYASLPLQHALPQSELAQDHGLILPLFPQITVEQQRRVVDTLEAALEFALRGCGAPSRSAIAGDAR